MAAQVNFDHLQVPCDRSQLGAEVAKVSEDLRSKQID
ncbi:hypothetical protein FIS3754_19460 [Fischerella sp. NIES-3754]|nr:hypothetical protein FIS3754_19460 [Fischerella sp. NIES-3754]